MPLLTSIASTTKRAIIGLIRFYQRFISPLSPPRCRFYPTCSQYALEAVQLHGAVKGSWLGAKRICRCHPWGGSGIDFVPLPVPKLKNCTFYPITSSRSHHLLQPKRLRCCADRLSD